MSKSTEDNFADWEGEVFGYGYGTGEPHILPALRSFLLLCPDGSSYHYQAIERVLGPIVAWLLINILAHADIIEYGTSPRFAWLTKRGVALKVFMISRTDSELEDLVSRSETYIRCAPGYCNCGPHGYEEGRRCANPFWDKDR